MPQSSQPPRMVSVAWRRADNSGGLTVVTGRAPGLVQVILGREPGRAVADLEPFRELPREPGSFTLVFGWTDLAGQVYPDRAKVAIRDFTVDILRRQEQFVQQGLRERYPTTGMPDEDHSAFADRMGWEMALRVVHGLNEAYPDVGAKSVYGRAAIRLVAWLVLTNPLIQQSISFERLVTLQVIFSFLTPAPGQVVFVPMVAADHGEPVPRTRN